MGSTEVGCCSSGFCPAGKGAAPFAQLMAAGSHDCPSRQPHPVGDTKFHVEGQQVVVGKSCVGLRELSVVLV